MQCFKEPRFADERRLVNYYGPDPSRYDRPDDPDVPQLQAPKEVDYWVKDEEPVPKAVPIVTKKVAVASTDSSASTTGMPVPAGPQLSLLDRLRRSIFGQPELANPRRKAPEG